MSRKPNPFWKGAGKKPLLIILKSLIDHKLFGFPFLSTGKGGEGGRFTPYFVEECLIKEGGVGDEILF